MSEQFNAYCILLRYVRKEETDYEEAEEEDGELNAPRKRKSLVNFQSVFST